MQFFIITLVLFVLLLPLVFWMYIFTAFFNHQISRSQFLFGVFMGALMSLPLLYQKYSFFGGLLTEVFLSLSSLGGSLYSFTILFFLTSIVLILWILFYVFEKISFPRERVIFKKYLLTFGVYFFLLSLGVFIIGVLSYFFIYTSPDISISFGNSIFYSLGTIVSYYIIVSFLEEGIKYLPSLRYFSQEKNLSFQSYMTLCACIALGFSFFENSIYAFSFYGKSGINFSLLQLVFFRSIFSISLHLIASIFFGAAFWHVYSYFRNQKIHILPVVFLASFAIASHTLFDTFLTYGYIGFLLIYIFILYIIISYLSTKQD